MKNTSNTGFLFRLTVTALLIATPTFAQDKTAEIDKIFSWTKPNEPGCAVRAAIDAGAQALKLFPATTYGPAHVKALRAVLPPVPLFAVGGITPANLGDYLRAGCIGAGLGGDLYQPGQDTTRTALKAREFIRAYRDASP